MSAKRPVSVASFPVISYLSSHTVDKS
jgi:hypothetical protein